MLADDTTAPGGWSPIETLMPPVDVSPPAATTELAELTDGNVVVAEIVPPEVVEIVEASLAEHDPQHGASPWTPKSRLVWLWHATWRLAGQVFGWVCLMVALAVLATIPLVQFISLGYLLHCSGQIARTGKLREGFVDLGKWARVGGLFLGTYLMLLPLRLLSQLANDAHHVSPGSGIASGWRIALLVLTVLVVGHILLAWYSGGKLRHFFWPLLAPFSLAQWVITRKVVGPIARPAIQWLSPHLADDLYQPAPLTSWFPPAILLAGLWRGPAQMYADARDAVWDFVVGLNLPHYFWLGLRGFVGAMIWLAIPLLMLMASTKMQNDISVLISFVGAFLCATVFLYLPFLQAHFAAENRFRAMFELGTIRKLFLRAPIAFWFSLLILLALALPLYLFKIQKVYDEFDWMFSVFFVLLIYPGRLLTGWAVGLARHREKPRFFLFRWAARTAAVAVCLIYAGFVYLSQFTSWYGSWSVFEQHPFLVPVPFLGG